jgi:hypothetical protein
MVIGDRFEVSGGSVLGTSHAQKGMNNQDALCWAINDSEIIAVVCDGCSSGRHNEMGAQLGARALTAEIARLLSARSTDSIDTILEAARGSLLDQLLTMTRMLGGTREETVHDFLLFSIVGAIVTQETYCIFSLGDGLQIVNGREHRIQYSDNAPPYLAYALCDESRPESPLRFSIDEKGETGGLRHLLIGSDGMFDLLASPRRNIPGTTEEVGEVARWWLDDRNFKNPYSITRRLTRFNTPARRRDCADSNFFREPGLLRDDTTLISIRRRPGELDLLPENYQ